MERGRGPSPLQKRVFDIERSHGELSRDVKDLKDRLNVKDNSAAEITKWIGRDVEITTVRGETYRGTLKWIDKYNYGISADEVTVLHKSNVESIRLSKR